MITACTVPFCTPHALLSSCVVYHIMSSFLSHRIASACMSVSVSCTCIAVVYTGAARIVYRRRVHRVNACISVSYKYRVHRYHAYQCRISIVYIGIMHISVV
jgi:hypothetical protein